MSDVRLYTEKQTAMRLSMSVSALQKSRAKGSTAIELGHAPSFIKIGSLVRYTAEDIENFISSAKQYALESESKSSTKEQNLGTVMWGNTGANERTDNSQHVEMVVEDSMEGRLIKEKKPKCWLTGIGL
ncbi:helix-turn-helix transcriptional regulator [Shewanella morhuae]|uniref:helix-turn-helix transcriptional regulator n=1 Tax=Shewanella morhuae TaxID=365591 RepID=UPI001BB95D29|nr:hypothetical protein [Shewanella morhuae]GIU11202.1 hypothetical protein TUM4641_28930 [Shewanella morhuae]